MKEWIATASLVFMAWRVFLVSRAVIDFTNSLPIINVNMVFNPQIVDAIKKNLPLYKQRTKKEKVA